MTEVVGIMDNPSLLKLLIFCFSTGICHLCLANEKTTRLQKMLCMVTRDRVTVIIYDESYDYSAPVLTMLQNCSHPSLLYEYGQVYNVLGRHMETVMKGPPYTRYRDQLNFILICGTICAENVLSHATFLDNTIGLRSLLRHFSTWLIISQDFPQYYNITLDNVAIVRLSALHQGQEPDTTHTKQIFPQEGDIQILWNIQAVAVYTLLWMPRGRVWSRVNTRDLTDEKPLYTRMFPNTQRGLNGRQLRLATVEWRPYAARHVKDGEVYYTGAGVDVMDMLGKMFNFRSYITSSRGTQGTWFPSFHKYLVPPLTASGRKKDRFLKPMRKFHIGFCYVVIEPEDMLWGRELENGSWNGVSGMIQRGEADSCPVPFGMSLGRKKIMDFSSPVLATEYMAFYRRRTDATKPWLYYLSCFSWQVFLCVAASLLWTVCLLVYMHRKANGILGPAKEKSAHVLKSLETGIRITLRQDMLTQPAVPSVRLVLCTLSVLCLVVTAMYTGNLVAFSTVDKYKPPFSTLQDLALQDEYAVGIFQGDFAENVLMSSDDTLLTSIYQKIIQSTNKTNYTRYDGNVVEKTIKRLIDDKYVLISTLAVKNIINSVTCDVEELKEKLFPVHSSFIFPHHSPLINLFDEQVGILRESGMMEKLIQDWTPKPKICDQAKKGREFKLDCLKSVLMTCSVGILVSVVILLVEIGKRKS